jgi:hypothetical protein
VDDDDDVGVGGPGVMSDEVEVDEMDKELSSAGWRGSGVLADGPAGSSDEEPITSFTMPLKSTRPFCFNIGSTNPGGGHTSSLNIEPVSDVRDFIRLTVVEEPSGLKTWVG